MFVQDKRIVVTGAAGGIGRALARRFARDGAKLVVCSDLDGDAAAVVAARIGGVSVRTDVSQEKDIQDLIERVESEHGPIDLFCSNAGVASWGGAEALDTDWRRLWDVNVMAHVWAARHLVPRMKARGGGYLLNTASAAGLLSQVGSAPYSVTKHAAVGLAEWLALTHGDDGIKVSVLCPQAVRTAMTADNPNDAAREDGMIEPDDVAEACVRGLEAETFMILPHPEVREYIRRKAGDYDRWISGMRKLNRRHQA